MINIPNLTPDRLLTSTDDDDTTNFLYAITNPDNFKYAFEAIYEVLQGVSRGKIEILYSYERGTHIGNKSWGVAGKIMVYTNTYVDNNNSVVVSGEDHNWEQVLYLRVRK